MKKTRITLYKFYPEFSHVCVRDMGRRIIYFRKVIIKNDTGQID